LRCGWAQSSVSLCEEFPRGRPSPSRPGPRPLAGLPATARLEAFAIGALLPFLQQALFAKVAAGARYGNGAGFSITLW